MEWISPIRTCVCVSIATWVCVINSYVGRLFALINKTHLTRKLGNAPNQLGIYYMNTSRFTKSAWHFQLGIDTFKLIKDIHLYLLLFVVCCLLLLLLLLLMMMMMMLLLLLLFVDDDDDVVVSVVVVCC